MKPKPASPKPSFQRSTLLVAAVVAASGLAVGAWFLFGGRGQNGNAAEPASNLKLEDIPFNGARAFEYLNQLCAIGPRPSGSKGMTTQQKLLADHFQKLGGQVQFQRFRVQHPQNGSWVPMANILVRWNPKSADRILLCAHYDTLPYPMEDAEDPHGVFVGANDNASGVAVLMELARDIPSIETKYGIDFLLLDGEEFIFTHWDRFFLGSEYFARAYAKESAKPHPAYRYRYGILLDMVGDADLKIHEERNSVWWRDTRPLVADVWATAARLKVREFVAKPKHEVSDDHIILHDVGGIPCIDVIDFDYPAWHTRGDTPDKCSPLSLAKVGWVIREWLKTAK
jgi:glutaminyl-peptide cyclotransferase